MTPKIVASFAGRVVPILFAFVVAAWPPSVLAQMNPHIGTWKRNEVKSKCDLAPTGKPPQSVMRTYEEFEGKGIKATFVTIGADGTRTTSGYSAHFDGKPYPYTGTSGFDTITLKRIDTHSWFATNKGAKAGNTGTNTVSKDGRTLTYTSKGTNAQGTPISCVQVFERQ